MNRSQLINELSRRTGRSVKEMRDIVEELQDVILSEVKSGDRVSLQGFGTFKPRLQTSRLARNPRNGVPVQLTPRTIIHFKCAPNLLDKMNG